MSSSGDRIAPLRQRDVKYRRRRRVLFASPRTCQRAGRAVGRAIDHARCAKVVVRGRIVAEGVARIVSASAAAVIMLQNYIDGLNAE